MFWILLALLILALIFPSIRSFAEKYAAKVGVWIGLIDSAILVLFGVFVLPSVTKMREDFGYNTGNESNMLYIFIGLASSVVLFLLSWYSNKEHKNKELFYPVYILGLVSMLLTVWSLVAVMDSISASSLIQ